MGEPGGKERGLRSGESWIRTRSALSCGRYGGFSNTGLAAPPERGEPSRPRIEHIRSEWRQRKAEALIEKRREEVHLERLRQSEADLERRYMLVDPANRLVAAELEAKLDAAKRERKLAEASPRRTEVGDLFSEEAFADLIELCSDFERIWKPPPRTATPRFPKDLYVLGSRVWFRPLNNTDSSRSAACCCMVGSTCE